jgi:hypothetical protein
MISERDRFHFAASPMARKRKSLRRINQNIPGALYDRFAATALREDRTKTSILVRALEVYVGASEVAAKRCRGNRSVGDGASESRAEPSNEE